LSWDSSKEVPGDERIVMVRNHSALRKSKPTVVIVEDHLGYLEKISKLLALDFEILAVATDGRRGLSATLRSKPDIVILDISLPELDGIAAAREIRRKGVVSKIVIATVHEDADFMNSALQAGANGFVFKSRLTADLIPAVNEVLAGRTFRSKNTMVRTTTLPHVGP
jgi:DNA-binding NarL/FixJ family response regulator